MTLRFLYEDQHLFILDKPTGLHSVRNPNSSEQSLADLLLVWNPKLADVSEKPGDAGLTQRLDFETSGCIVGTKDKESWYAFRKLLMQGKVNKYYHALLEGNCPKFKELSTYIGSAQRRAHKVRVFLDKPKPKFRALAAKTRFECLSFSTDLNLSLVKIYAPIARRHQIRAHAAFIEHSLVGDTLYGSERLLSELFPNIKHLPRFYLQAHTLKFPHPKTGLEIVCESKTPEWVDAFTLLQAP